MDESSIKDSLNKPLEEIMIEDVFKTALAMEKRGEKIYYLLAEKIPNVKIKEVLLILSEEESKHYKRFQEMSFEVQHIMTHSIPGTLAAITKYTQGKIFDDVVLKQKLKNLSDLDSIFEFAMGIELDSILLYQELKDVVSPNLKSIINDFIDQERFHFLRILQLKQTKT